MGKTKEPIRLMEPMLPAEGNRALEDLAFDLSAKASSLASQIKPIVREAIGDLVRSMNCYYSNLIEGHHTHPRDIDKALANEFSANKEQRNLQLEARAHIEVQQMIDKQSEGINPFAVDYISWLHREFCLRLPDELLWVENPDTNKKLPVVPGEYRKTHVQVGVHIALSAEVLPEFLARFAEGYNPTSLSKLRQVIAIPAAHHRLLWVHPFLDGNGRVARLLSHAWLRSLGIGNSLWSVSRGLARRVRDYKALLMAADEPRRGDYDGRGNLTLKGLEDFCTFFLEACIDQVDYMQSVLEPTALMARMERYAEEEIQNTKLPRGSFALLRHALLSGEFERGKAPTVSGYKERQARTVLSKLIDAGLLVSSGPKAPVRLGFPSHVVDRWFPKLYPEG